MERSARRSSARGRRSPVSTVARLGSVLGVAALAAAGCTQSMQSGYLDAPGALDGRGVETVSTDAAWMRSPQLAATPASDQTRPTGMGLQASAVFDMFGGLTSTAFVPPNMEAPEYSQLFDNGGLIDIGDMSIGLNLSLIIQRPQAGAAALGDTYALIGLDYRTFDGKPFGIYGADTMSVMAFWVDAKTMLSPGRTIKPYLNLGIGVARISETALLSPVGGVLYEATWSVCLRASIGVDIRRGSTGLFVDIGMQMIGAPNLSDAARAAPLSLEQGEEIVTLPVRAGLVFNF